MSYGFNIVDGFHQLRLYSGLFLEGAKPADLPVVQTARMAWAMMARGERYREPVALAA